MKIFRDNVPYLLSFVVYWTFYTASLLLIWLGIRFVIIRFLSPLPDFINSLLVLGLASFLSYSSFLASIRWVALPMIKRYINIPVKNGQGSLVMVWFLFILFIFLFGKLPTAFLPLLPIEKQIQGFISFGWMTIVSFALYKDAVSDYAFKTKEEKLANEDDPQAKVG